MTQEERDQVVVLIRCAADIRRAGELFPLAKAQAALETPEHLVHEADRAICSVMNEYNERNESYDHFVWLEAAARVEEGRYR